MKFLTRLFGFLRKKQSSVSEPTSTANRYLNPTQNNHSEVNQSIVSNVLGVSESKISTLTSPTYLPQESTLSPVIFDETPDEPIDFGFKINWFAIATEDPLLVIDALQLKAPKVANWQSGLAVAIPSINNKDKRKWIFVSPPIEGWVFIVGTYLPYPVMHTEDRHDGIGQKFDELANRLSEKFADVQFFGNYRVVGFVAWARFIKGEMVRVFSFAEGLYANLGKQTKEEALLKLPCLDGLSLSDADDKLFAYMEQDFDEDSSENTCFLDETGVIEMAELWSINPLNNSFTEWQAATGFIFELDEINF